MQEIIWMFPILFIVHDMEEIMGFGLWLGAFIAYTFHLIVHIGQSIVIKNIYRLLSPALYACH